MATYYHVTGTEYQEGEDLLCRNELELQGRAPEWKWEDAEEGFDGDVVCLFDNRAEAENFRADYLPAGRILTINLPDDDLIGWGIYTRRVAEGYLAVKGSIPAEYITVA